MLREAVHKAEVEITKELGIVFQDNKQNAHYSGVEALHRRWHFLARYQVMFQEYEALNEQVLDLALL
jgi:hypothetical protein